MSNNNLKRQLLQDWGYDLPISTNDFASFATRQNPIKIDAHTSQMPNDVAYWTIRGLHKGEARVLQSEAPRGLWTGLWWRSVSDGLVAGNEIGLAKYQIQRKILGIGKGVNETTSFYFDVSAVVLNEPSSGERRTSYCVPNSKLYLPREIGWLKHDADQSKDYGELHNAPELGVGIAYAGDGVEATIFVYPGSEASADRLSEEWSKATKDLQRVSPQCQALGEPTVQRNFRAGLWVTERASMDDTCIAMSFVGGHIIKVRLTWHRDPVVHDIAMNFLAELGGLGLLKFQSSQ